MCYAVWFPFPSFAQQILRCHPGWRLTVRCHSALLADSWQLITFIFLPLSPPRIQILHIRSGWRFTVRHHSERGQRRIFILFFCVIPPSQYPPSGFAGHLLINKEAYPIPILPVRIPFLNTVANPLLALWMTPYRLRSFWTGERMLCRKTGNKTMNRSEESMTRMTSYRLPHYGSRSFTFASDDD